MKSVCSAEQGVGARERLAARDPKKPAAWMAAGASRQIVKSVQGVGTLAALGERERRAQGDADPQPERQVIQRHADGDAQRDPDRHAKRRIAPVRLIPWCAWIGCRRLLSVCDAAWPVRASDVLALAGEEVLVQRAQIGAMQFLNQAVEGNPALAAALDVDLV